MEIQALRSQLDSHTKAQAEKEMKLEDEQFEKEAQTRHEEQMLEIQLARTALKERIEHLNRLILCSKSTGVNTQGNFSALGRFSRMSINDSGSRSLRSSVSQSTLGAWGYSIRPTSFMSINSNDFSPNMALSNGSIGNEDDDDTMGEFADGKASLQRHVVTLQADLGDKNRYIATLERRLLQARRSSHSRMSAGMKAGNTGTENTDTDTAAIIREKDMEINELRSQLDDKDRMLAALRSATRHRDVARVATDPVQTPNSDTNSGSKSPEMLNSPRLSLVESEKEKKRKSVDEVSKMLDEMIQDRVESGHIIKGSRGSVRVAADSRRTSTQMTGVPILNATLDPVDSAKNGVTE